MAINLEKYRKYKELLDSKQKSSGGGYSYWKPKSGQNLIRILPNGNLDAGVHFRETAYHYGIGADEKTFVCLRAEGKTCPICELRDQLYGTKDAQLAEMAAELSPKPKVYFNMIDRQHPELGVQIGTLTGRRAFEQVHEAIINYFNDPLWGDLTDPYQGRDITIEKKGAQLDTEYQVRPSPQVTPICPDQAGIQAILGQLKDLEKIVKFSTEEEMLAGLGDVQEIASRASGGQLVAAPAPAPIARPIHTPAPAQPAPAPKAMPPVAGRKFWIVNEKGEVEEVFEVVVQKLVDAGMNPDVMLVGEEAWKKASDYGLKQTPPPAPPKPIAPAKPTPPAPVKPVPPAKPTAPAAPKPVATPAAPKLPPAPTSGPKNGVQVPEQYQACFGKSYDGTQDVCQMCPYEDPCTKTMRALQK